LRLHGHLPYRHCSKSEVEVSIGKGIGMRVSGRTFSVPGRRGGHYLAGPQGLRPDPAPSQLVTCRVGGRPGYAASLAA